MTTIVVPNTGLKHKVRKVTLTHHDGTHRVVSVSDRETPFPKGKLLISHTDTEGKLTYVNPLLAHVSGYKEAELIGSPHYIFRHPDMPASVFKDLWKTILGGHIWQGPVKCLRKDGGFFWCDMTVTPNTRKGKLLGYISVRHELSREEIREFEDHYATLRLN